MDPFRLALCLLLALLAPHAHAVNTPPGTQLSALQTIYAALYGSAAPSSPPCGGWHVNGQVTVRCAGSFPYHVTEVKAPYASGSMPSEIGNLPELTKITLMKAEGTIPTQVGLLTKLQHLLIQTGAIGGTIPTEVVGLTKLKVFHINSLPNMVGSLPPGLLTSLTRLTELFIHNLPQLEGTFPLGSDGLGDVEYYRVSKMPKLEGVIPPMGGMAKVQDLIIEDTLLIGTIPAALGTLTALYNLKIAGNANLHGTIPDIFGSGSLYDVDFSRNPKLTGMVPGALGGLTIINSFKASDCDLVGTLPDNIGNAMSAPYTLELANNRLQGTVPASLSGFSTCALHGNWFKSNGLSPACPIFPLRPTKGVDVDTCGFNPC